MKKSIAALTIACFILLSASSQTLFTYGKYKADVNDFLNAYNKNNPGPTTNKSKAVNEYLTLYINSKLKIREAYDRRFDTLPQKKWCTSSTLLYIGPTACGGWGGKGFVS